jgi:hypothetical protein
VRALVDEAATIATQLGAQPVLRRARALLGDESQPVSPGPAAPA